MVLAKIVIEVGTHIVLPLAVSLIGAYLFKRLENKPASPPVPSYEATEDRINGERLERSYEKLSNKYDNLKKDYDILLEKVNNNNKDNFNLAEYFELYRTNTLKGIENGSPFQVNLNAPSGPPSIINESSFDSTLIDAFYVKLFSELSDFDLSGLAYF